MKLKMSDLALAVQVKQLSVFTLEAEEMDGVIHLSCREE